MIALKRVSLAAGGCSILTDVTLRVEPKEWLCVVGQSASGKTALFNLFVRAIAPTSGIVTVDGADLASLPLPVLQLYRSRLGLIFQDPRLLAHLTARENVAFPLHMRGEAGEVVAKKTDELLSKLGLSRATNLLPASLSSGEQACVGIARALVTQPLILIADEPFHALDTAQASAALTLLREAHDRGTTIIILTKDACLAALLPCRTLTLEKGKIAGDALEKKTETAQPAIPGPSILAVETLHAPAKRVPPGRKRTQKKIRITAIGSDAHVV